MDKILTRSAACKIEFGWIEEWRWWKVVADEFLQCATLQRQQLQDVHIFFNNRSDLSWSWLFLHLNCKSCVVPLLLPIWSPLMISSSALDRDRVEVQSTGSLGLLKITYCAFGYGEYTHRRNQIVFWRIRSQQRFRECWEALLLSAESQSRHCDISGFFCRERDFNCYSISKPCSVGVESLVVDRKLMDGLVAPAVNESEELKIKRLLGNRPFATTNSSSFSELEMDDNSFSFDEARLVRKLICIYLLVNNQFIVSASA